MLSGLMAIQFKNKIQIKWMGIIKSYDVTHAARSWYAKERKGKAVSHDDVELNSNVEEGEPS